MHIATTADHKYMHKALAMYESLKKVIPFGFVLHFLCLDDITYDALAKLKLPGIVPYNLTKLEEGDPELRAAKNNPPSQYGDQYSQYVWTCTPYFIYYLLCKWNLPNVLYVDADIFFYGSPKIIYDTVGNKSVGIHTQRFTGNLEDQPKLNDGIGTTNISGWYNVGVVAFRQTPQARAIAIMWKNWLLRTDNMFYKDYGTCGDQKYLEIFVPLFGKDNICVFDQEGPIVHKAPWCTDGPSDILFYHFSHSTFDVAANTWTDHVQDPPEWSPATAPDIKVLYENYFEVIKSVSK